jgi:PKD repeat protein
MLRRYAIGWTVLCLLLAVSLPASAQSLSIGGYELVSSTRLSRTVFEYVYKARMTNTGEAVVNASGVVASRVPNVTIVEATLTFGNVGQGETVQSVDTFTVRHDRSAPFTEADLSWTISADPAVALRARFSATPASGPAPLRVTFVPDPITTSAIVNYQWDLDGNGSFGVAETVGRNQIRTYTAPGDVAVQLRVTDSLGRQDTQTLIVRVGNAPPVVTASAQPSNGQVPLTVSFTATATDNEGIGLYEWDFEGDGVFDYSSTSTASTSFTYQTVGTYGPVLRVTDRQGASTTLVVATTEVRAAPQGSPSVTANASPTQGQAALNVNFSGTASDPQNQGFNRYEWDFQGDGVYDFTSTASATTSFRYTAAGTFFARLRVTTVDGRSAEDVVQVTVQPSLTLHVSTDTIDPDAGETVDITTTLGGDTVVSLVIERRGAAGVVRTLVANSLRAAGTYVDRWDGKDDAGIVLPEGDYYAVLVYQLNGVAQRLDLALTTGGVQYNPPRSGIPPTFSPFAGQPLNIDFTLSRASEVTAFIGRFNVDTRLVTFLQREVLGRGTYRITWNGENGEGVLIKPPPGDRFLFGIFGYTLPDNAIVVKSGAQIGGVAATPSIFDPTTLDNDGNPALSYVSFSLSRQATVELVVSDVTTGTVLGRFQYPNRAAGANLITWDGKTNSGVLVAPGRYRLGLTAVQSNGKKSITQYVLQRVFY